MPARRFAAGRGELRGMTNEEMGIPDAVCGTSSAFGVWRDVADLSKLIPDVISSENRHESALSLCRVFVRESKKPDFDAYLTPLVRSPQIPLRGAVAD